MSAAFNRRRHLLPEMEGVTARWYARIRNTPSQRALYKSQAAQLTSTLNCGSHVLEVAPGPGYLSIEIAKLGRLKVSAIDISREMCAITRENAAAEAVEIDTHQGDVGAMPYEDESFDLVVCQAAFKNFRRPIGALDEMWRVLRPGGTAVIQDMWRDATNSDIDKEVAGQQLSGLTSFIVRGVLRRLRRRAFTVTQFDQLAAMSRFGSCGVLTAGITIETRFAKVRGDR